MKPRTFISSLKDFLKSKEARSFWVAIGFIFVLILISVFATEGWIKYVDIALLILVAGILFVNSFKKIKSSSNLSLEQSLLDSIVKYLDDAVITYDQNFKVLNFNKSAEKLFQLKEAEIIGQDFSLQQSSKNPRFSLLRQVMFPSLAPSIRKISKPGAYPQVVHLSFETPYLELQSITIPIQPEQGKPKAFVKIITDQTRQISIVKSKNEFVTVASHQLRTPISAINWAFQELSKPELSAGQRKEIFEAGSKAAQKLSNIIKDFLNVAKIEEGRFGYNFEKTQIITFIEEVVAQAAIVAKQHGINLYFEKPKQDFEITADK
ncbi:MAG: histidine kinase dimerization/phospho-acceptor domain-containing protein, partial [bacterium]|nr:histidine kinase dimerization/phospho-acceptor domain-containing protein [bacterium]